MLISLIIPIKEPLLFHFSKCRWLQYTLSIVAIFKASCSLCLQDMGFQDMGFLFSSPEPKAHGELIVYQSIRRPCVNIFKLQYLRNQWSNRNDILTEPSLGWGKGCIRFWARSDRNSGAHGNG